MLDVHHAVAMLRERTGVGDLELNRNGEVELVFDDGVAIRLHRIDDTALELSTVVGSLGAAPAADRLVGLLFANHLGQTTGSARIAVDRDAGTVLLGERLVVTDLEADAVERRLLGFVDYAKVWIDGKVEALLADASAEPSNAAPDGSDDLIIRG